MWHHMNNGWGMGLSWIFMVLVWGLIMWASWCSASG